MDGQTILFIDNNGYVHESHEEPASPIASCIILSVLFLLGFTFNFALLVVIVLKKDLRSEVFNIILIFITSTCLLDCLINETTAFVFLLSWRSVASSWWCEYSSATFMLILILQTSGVCLICLERYLALKGKPLDTKETYSCIVSCWVFAIVSRIWAGSAPVNYFPSRNVCGVTQGHEGVSVTTLLFGFIIPWITMSALVSASLVQYYDKIKTIQEAQTLTTLRNTTSADLQIPTMEVKHYKITLKVLFFYSILILPHTLIVLVSQVTSPTFFPNHWENPRNVITGVRAVSSGVHDTIFTWCRYQYNVIIPVLVFVTYKNLRKHCKQLFLHRQRQNSISNVESKSSPRVRNNFVQASHGTVPEVASNMMTPVLFATSNGLQLRTTFDETEERQPSTAHSSFSVSVCDLTIDENVFTVKNANVMAPLEQIEEEEEEEENTPLCELGAKKNVRFASVVNEIPLLESGVFGSSDETPDEANLTHTVELPVFVKSDISSSGSTFVKSTQL